MLIRMDDELLLLVFLAVSCFHQNMILHWTSFICYDYDPASIIYNIWYKFSKPIIHMFFLKCFFFNATAGI